MNVQNNNWEETEKAKKELEKELAITKFLIVLANPKNWSCSGCYDSVYNCQEPHGKDVWIGDLDEDKVPIEIAMELLAKLGE